MTFSHAALGTWAIALTMTSGSAWSQQGESSSVIPPSGIALAGEGLASLTPTGLANDFAFNLGITIEPMAPTTKVAVIPGEYGDEPGNTRFNVRAQATWMGMGISGWRTDSSIMLTSSKGWPMNLLSRFGPLTVDLADGKVWSAGNEMFDLHLFNFDAGTVIVHQTLHEPAAGDTRTIDIDIVVPTTSVVFSDMAAAFAASSYYDPSKDQVAKYVRLMHGVSLPFAELRFQASYTLADGASISVVPEPASLWMMAVGLCLLGAQAARRQS